MDVNGKSMVYGEWLIYGSLGFSCDRVTSWTCNLRTPAAFMPLFPSLTVSDSKKLAMRRYKCVDVRGDWDEANVDIVIAIITTITYISFRPFSSSSSCRTQTMKVAALVAGPCKQLQFTRNMPGHQDMILNLDDISQKMSEFVLVLLHREWSLTNILSLSVSFLFFDHLKSCFFICVRNHLRHHCRTDIDNHFRRHFTIMLEPCHNHAIVIATVMSFPCMKMRWSCQHHITTMSFSCRHHVFIETRTLIMFL